MALTWSISRDQTLHTCERRYYFRYLLPARINSRNKTLREIAFVKKVTNIPSWKGRVFHSLIAGYIRRICNRDEIPLTDLLASCRRQMQKQWKSSVTNSSRSNLNSISRENPFLLLEHLDPKESVPENMLDVTIKDVENWTEKWHAWANSMNIRCILGNSRVWVEPSGGETTSFELEGIKVVTKADLATLTQQGQFSIYDWKTTSPTIRPTRWITQEEFQAAVYQLWPHSRLGVPLDAVSAHFVYLGGDSLELRSFKVDKNMQDYTLSLIRRSALRMQYFSQIHHDRSQSTIDKTSRFTLNDLDFAYSEKVCVGCQFKHVCRKELENA